VDAEIVGRVIAVARPNLVNLDKRRALPRGVGLRGQERCAGLGHDFDPRADSGAI